MAIDGKPVLGVVPIAVVDAAPITVLDVALNAEVGMTFSVKL